MIIFTSICANYAHKARVLARSVHAFIPDATFVLCLTERGIPAALAGEECFDRIIRSRDMWEGNFDRFIFKHDIVEASTAVKGACFRWLMKTYPAEKDFVYLDPDCRVYSDLQELREALETAPAVVCPHLLHPGNIDMELSSTAHGVFNLGFLAVRNSEEGRRLINWWAERLYLFCYDDIANGIFTDQKWMDLAPCFFDVRILRHYGYDLAIWNLQDTAIEQKDGEWRIQGMLLRFIHFSGFGKVAEDCMDKWLGEENQGFRELYKAYAAEHAAADTDGISATPWSYAAYHSGEPVERKIREAYRKNWDVMFSLEDPFARSNRDMAELLGLSIPPGKRIQKKWKTAKRLLQEEGAGAVLERIGSKVRRKSE